MNKENYILKTIKYRWLAIIVEETDYLIRCLMAGFVTKDEKLSEKLGM